MTDPSFCTHDFVSLSTYLTYPYLSRLMFQAGSRGRQAHLDDRKTWQDMARQDGARRAPRHGCKTSESRVLNISQLSPLRSSETAQCKCCGTQFLFCWASKVWLSSLRGIRWGSDSSWLWHRTTQGATNGAVASGRAKVEKPKRSSELTSQKASESIWKHLKSSSQWV